MTKLCDVAAERPPKSYHLELRNRDQVLVGTTVEQPPAMNLKATATNTKWGYRIKGTTELPIHRIIAWSAETRNGETTKIHWTSEQNPGVLRKSGQAFEVEVPYSSVEGCSDCAIGVQAVSDLRVGEVTVSSEGVVLLAMARVEK